MARRKQEVRNGLRVGDTYLVRVTVTNIWDETEQVTLDFPAYGTPITLPLKSLERDDFIAEEREEK